jgi:excisionase family DNA binding protein
MTQQSANANDSTTAKLLLTVNESAALLGCSRANVYGLIEAGELPVVAVGKSRGYRIDRRDLDEFIHRRKFRKEGEKPVAPAPRPRLKHIRL